MILFALRIINQLILGSLKKTKLFINHQPHQPHHHHPHHHPHHQNNIPYYEVPFRCYPIDMDTNLHINNACYFRVAELSRWRVFPESNMYRLSIEKGAR